MEKEKLKEIVENTISGEWGTEEKKDENDIFVIRTADFFNDGRINYNNVIIKDTDTYVIENTKENIITLITCVENKPELRRCVQGRLNMNNLEENK